MVDAIIFDLDGTLTDSASGIRKSFLATFQELGLKVPHTEEIEIGPPIAETLHRILGSQKHRYDEALAIYRKFYSEIGISDAALYPGVADLLAKLFDRRIKLSIATAKLSAFASTILNTQGIASIFEGRIYGSGPNGEFSDKKELLRFIMNTQKFRHEKTLMVGDRKHDIIAAKSNELSSVGVTWGYASSSELTEAGATWIISSPKELENICFSE